MTAYSIAIAIKLAQEGVKTIAVHYHTRQDEADTTASFVKDAGADIAALRLAEQLGAGATVVTVMCDTGMKYLRTFGEL